MAKKTKRTKVIAKASKAGGRPKGGKTKRQAPQATEVLVEGPVY